MKLSFLLLIPFVLFSCKTIKVYTKVDYDNNLPRFIKSIKEKDLKKHLYTFSSDKYEGRESGEKGQKLAAKYLKNYYLSMQIESPIAEGNYYQKIPENTYDRAPKESENVLAFIKGSEKPEEVLVLSAHYDHVGIDGETVYNGADDDGSGTVALLEIAQAFKKAIAKGFTPKRSILFLHVTAEEKGLFGSKYYTDHPIFPLEKTIANLNIDMIGRQDPEHENDDNYVYLIGSDKLSTELHNISEQINQKHINLNLDYKFRENDPDRYYYRSDHYNFAKNNIPVIFYFNGVHADYHKPTDTAEKINYELLAKRTKLIFATAWELANRKESPKLD